MYTMKAFVFLVLILVGQTQWFIENYWENHLSPQCHLRTQANIDPDCKTGEISDKHTSTRLYQLTPVFPIPLSLLAKHPVCARQLTLWCSHWQDGNNSTTTKMFLHVNDITTKYPPPPPSLLPLSTSS